MLSRKLKMRIKQLNRSLLLGLITGIVLATQAISACNGTDLRMSLPQDDLDQVAQKLTTVPFAQGNHWRLTSEGKTLHLIGTIHLADPRLDPIAKRLAGVVENSELLLLEVTPVEEAALKADFVSRPELLFLQNESIPELLPEDDWTRLSDAMNQRNIAPLVGSRFQPWYLSMILSMPPCMMAEIKSGGNYGLDFRLRDIAIAADIPMKALEPHDRLFQVFNVDTIEKQIELLMLGLDFSDRGTDALATTIAAYFDQKAMEAWEISRLQSTQIEGQSKEELEQVFSKFEDRLLISRNQEWIPVINTALEHHDQITIAVGAGHLGGENGLLALLEKQGFAPERLPF